MKKFKNLKKNQISSLNFFLFNIKKYTFLFFKKQNKIVLKKKLFIDHNKNFLLPLFFDLLIFYRKKKKSFFIKILQKKKQIKFLYSFSILKIQSVKSLFLFDLYSKFVSFIFKKGKKFFWDTALALIFSNLSLKFSYSRSIILAKIFIRLFTRVELKKVSSKKRISYIPVFITVKRSLFLALKWIFLGVLNNTTKISFYNKLYIELVQLLALKSCFTLKKLEDNNFHSFNNRSNVHYRWDR